MARQQTQNKGKGKGQESKAPEGRKLHGYVVKLEGVKLGNKERSGFYRYVPSSEHKCELVGKPEEAQRHTSHERGSQWFHWLTGGLKRRGGPICTAKQAKFIAVYRKADGTYETEAAEPMPAAEVAAAVSGARVA